MLVCGLLFVGCCVLFATPCSLSVVRGLLFAVCFVLFDVMCVLFAVMEFVV